MRSARRPRARRYFASVSSRQLLPTTRVEYALRGDDLLDETDVRELMQAYITLRSRRIRSAAAPANGASPAAPDATRDPAPQPSATWRDARRSTRKARGGSSGRVAAPA